MIELKDLLVQCLKKQNKRHFAYQLAEKYNLKEEYIKQCKRYSLDPEEIKVRRLNCSVACQNKEEEEMILALNKLLS